MIFEKEKRELILGNTSSKSHVKNWRKSEKERERASHFHTAPRRIDGERDTLLKHSKWR